LDNPKAARDSEQRELCMNMRENRLDRETRLRLARHIRANRAAETREAMQGGEWTVFNSNLQRIHADMGFETREVVGRLQAANPNRKIRILDLGCLEGTAIREIADNFSNVEAHGLSIKRMPQWGGAGNISWHVAHNHNTRLPSNHFDFVYSYFGLTHSQPYRPAFAELNRILAHGGEAKINLMLGGVETSDQMAETGRWKQELEEAGFEVLEARKKRMWNHEFECALFHIRKRVR